MWCFAGLNADAAAELEAIRGNLAKYKGKMGKEFEDIAINEMDWVCIVTLINCHNTNDNTKQHNLNTVVWLGTKMTLHTTSPPHPNPTWGEGMVFWQKW